MNAGYDETSSNCDRDFFITSDYGRIDSVGPWGSSEEHHRWSSAIAGPFPLFLGR